MFDVIVVILLVIVKRTKSHGTRLRLVPYFPRYDVICDLLQDTRSLKQNPFVNLSNITPHALDYDHMP